VVAAAGCEKKFNEEYCVKHGDDPAYAAYCHADANNIDALIPDGPPGTHRIIGAVSGLFAGTLVLQNNGGDDLPLTTNGAFYFATALMMGASYDVTVKTQPMPLTCDVANPSGTVGSEDVKNIVVSCTGDPGIKCGTTYCAVGDTCCLDTAKCTSVAGCGSLKMPCDDTADCTGGVCCAELNGGGNTVQNIICETLTSCENGNHEVLCDPDAPGGDPACTAPQMCVASPLLSGYHFCQ
jgi:hypothetical protein